MRAALGYFIAAVVMIAGFIACSSSSSSGGGYKYQITGTTAMTVGAERLQAFANNFVMRWNESADGTISGVFINNTTGMTFNISGTATATERNITVAIPASQQAGSGGIATIELVVPGAGDISGSVSVDVTTKDAQGGTISTGTIVVDAETTIDGNASGGNSGGNGGGSSSGGSNSGGSNSGGSSNGGSNNGGPADTLSNYQGMYTGTVTENVNTDYNGGPMKHCSHTSGTVKAAFSASYTNLVIGVNQAGITSVNDLQGALFDLSGITISDLSVNKTYNGGFPPAVATSDGTSMTGIKIPNPNPSSQRLTVDIQGAFSGTGPRLLSLTYSAKLDNVEVCNYTMVLTKQ